jgi:hypothetical protein
VRPHGDRVPLVRDRVRHRQHDGAVRQLGDDQLVGAFREELSDAGHQPGLRRSASALVSSMLVRRRGSGRGGADDEAPVTPKPQP